MSSFNTLPKASPAQKTPITVAKGDGIGPEIMDATLRILEAAGAALEIEEIEIGEKVYNKGVMTGIEDSAWDSLRRTRVFLKAPIFTPMGGGFKSLNVTVRKTMGFYANVRPCVSYKPYVDCHFDNVDMVIVRENEEDLYAGIEYRNTQDVCTALKVISRPGSERIIRYAFEYARANNRKKVTCMVKDNIMKVADGLFYKVFEEIAKDYPEIQNDRYIIDIGAARIASAPEKFDVIVTENLYGDIISDIAADVTGSVGLGISANIGDYGAMFEAMHGTAPDIAGKGIANPSGLIQGAVMMLVHIGQNEVAAKIQNAWLKTLEDGIHTGDLHKDGLSKKRVGTKDFADAVIERLGQKPSQLKSVDYGSEGGALQCPPVRARIPQKKDLVGVDVFIDWEGHPDDLAAKVKSLGGEKLPLKIISNRGVKVWPNGAPETFCSDSFRLRYLADTVSHAQVTNLLGHLATAGFDYTGIENLYNFDGQAGFTKAQGE